MGIPPGACHNPAMSRPALRIVHSSEPARAPSRRPMFEAEAAPQQGGGILLALVISAGFWVALAVTLGALG